jgi:hypothetical protein
VSYLPLPAGYPKKSLITGGDPTGRYQVGRIYPAGGPKAVIWDGRRPTVVDLPGSDDTLSDVNSAGLAVGSSFRGDKAVAWAYEGGKITQLAGEGSAADAVNERGEIAGTVQDQPVVWRSVTAQPKRLAMPSGSLMGQARGIDEDGTVIGTAIAVGGKSRAYAWSPDGTARLLDLPPTTPSGVPNGSFAFSVRNGWISGEAIVEVSEGAEYHYSTVWNLATGDVKLTPDVGRVAAVNAQGWLVGRGTDRLVLVTDTVVVGLPLPDGAKIGRYDEVDTVSDDGRIGAGELNPQNDLTGARALIWTCS